MIQSSIMSDLPERFWAKVRKSDGCWIWTAALNPKGYGKFGVNKRTMAAHRLAYADRNGPIPDDLFVLHRCDTPSCVNPDHLFLGTQSDNLQDCKRKGRSWFYTHPERAAKGDDNGSRKHPEKLKRGNDHPNSKLTLEAVRDIRAQAVGRQRGTYARLAEKYNVTLPLIGAVVNRRIWKHVE